VPRRLPPSAPSVRLLRPLTPDLARHQVPRLPSAHSVVPSNNPLPVVSVRLRLPIPLSGLLEVAAAYSKHPPAVASVVAAARSALQLRLPIPRLAFSVARSKHLPPLASAAAAASALGHRHQLQLSAALVHSVPLLRLLVSVAPRVPSALPLPHSLQVSAGASELILRLPISAVAVAAVPSPTPRCREQATLPTARL
jgi:hypothetical protein